MCLTFEAFNQIISLWIDSCLPRIKLACLFSNDESVKCCLCPEDEVKFQFDFSQIIIFMALAAGTSRVRTGPITLHTQTAMHFVQALTGVSLSKAIVSFFLLFHHIFIFYLQNHTKD